MDSFVINSNYVDHPVSTVNPLTVNSNKDLFENTM